MADSMIEMTKEETIRRIFHEHLDVEESRITRDAHMFDDLGCDSLDGVEIAIIIEDELDIDILNSVMDDFVTFGDVVRYVEGL